MKTECGVLEAVLGADVAGHDVAAVEADPHVEAARDLALPALYGLKRVSLIRGIGGGGDRSK
jgi:hypothetical protein